MTLLPEAEISHDPIQILPMLHPILAFIHLLIRTTAADLPVGDVTWCDFTGGGLSTEGASEGV